MCDTTAMNGVKRVQYIKKIDAEKEIREIKQRVDAGQGDSGLMILSAIFPVFGGLCLCPTFSSAQQKQKTALVV